MIRTIIIDDDEKAREALNDSLKLYCKNIEIVSMADSVASGYKCILKNKPDIVFLDIEMPDGTGFDLLTKINKIEFKLIFCTAFQKYALKAFKFSAIDYLLKPVDSDELKEAVARMGKMIDNENLELKLKAFDSHYNTDSNEKRKMVLKTQDQIHYIDVECVVRCESYKNYTQFFLEDKREIVVSKTLKEYEEMLQEFGFYRVHQSHLVNLKNIISYNKIKNRKRNKDLDKLGDCEGYIALKDQSKIPVSQRKRDVLLKLLAR